MFIPSNSQESQVEARQEAEQFIEAALDALSAHIAILDHTGTIIAVNQAWRRFADTNGLRNPTYGIGTDYLAVCDAASQRSSSDAYLVAQGIRAIISGQASNFELEYPCHSPNQRRWFVVRISQFEWYGNIQVIVAHQNVTELKQIQIELSESKHRLEAILDNVNNGILTINTSGIIETANLAAARIFDYDSEELPGFLLQQLIEEPVGYQSLRDWDGSYAIELTGKRRSGSLFPLSIAVNQLHLNSRKFYTCIIQDITYRKRMEAEIIEREKIQIALEKERELRDLKNRFISMMGHELNTPLTAISLSYDMLKKYRHIATEEENEQALDNIQQQVEHLHEMVKDVMTLSRSEVEAMSIELEMADLITYCRDVVEEFQFTYHKTHQIEFECDETDIRAPIDRRMLRRSLTNLLSNAIKYSPQGGKVLFQLAVIPNTGKARIEVSDSGIGIPPEDWERLFDPFHRAGNVSNLPGTGLGLAIVRQIIDQHGGSISFESIPGQGTIFRIDLPLHLPDLVMRNNPVE